jgi:hypothetical protein
MIHGNDQEGATDKNSREATEASHDGIESDLVGTAAVGGPDPPCSTRASGPAPLQAGAGCGNPKAGRMALRASCASSSRRSPVQTIIRATLRSSSGHRRRGRLWSATRRAGTVSETTQAHEGARCSKVAGNVVALLRAAVQARKRLCRDGSGLRGYRSRVSGAAVCSDEERGVR